MTISLILWAAFALAIILPLCFRPARSHCFATPQRKINPMTQEKQTQSKGNPQMPNTRRFLCFEIPNGHVPIQLWQRGKDNFEVIYGKQVESRLTYGRAAAKLGAAIMHSLSCDGLID